MRIVDLKRLEDNDSVIKFQRRQKIAGWVYGFAVVTWYIGITKSIDYNYILGYWYWQKNIFSLILIISIILSVLYFVDYIRTTILFRKWSISTIKVDRLKRKITFLKIYDDRFAVNLLTFKRIVSLGPLISLYFFPYDLYVIFGAMFGFETILDKPIAIITIVLYVLPLIIIKVMDSRERKQRIGSR